MATKTRGRKKVTTPVEAVPSDLPYEQYVTAFGQIVEPQHALSAVKKYVQKKFPEKRAANILKAPDWKLKMSNVAAYAVWTTHHNKEAPEETDAWMKDYFKECEQIGKEKSSGPKDDGKPSRGEMLKERMAEKLNDTIGQIEEWVDNQPSKTVPKFFEWMKVEKVAPQHISKIRDFYEPQKDEIDLVVSGKADADLKEGYSAYKKTELNQLKKFYDTLLDDIDAYAEFKRKTRKTPIKKAPSKDKLVQKVKFKQTDDKYKITSVDPRKIIGASEVWVFNTKTRKLGRYIAAENQTLSIKGTTIQFFDEDKSVAKNLRKPEKQLADFNKCGKVKLRTFMDTINAVDIKLNGRLNDETVILRAE